MVPVLLRLVGKRGHKVFTRGDYNLNIVGVRNLDSTQSNDFDDLITVTYKVSGKWITKSWTATTDPGTHYLHNPMRVEGTAILCPGQYRSVYKIDGHGVTRYEALCQRNGKVKVYRDSNKDDVLDYDSPTTEGYYGINIHRAHKYREVSDVNKYSAGCQVFADPADFAEFMALVHKSAEIYGNSFTYTLIEL
tara:strand:- start:74 stop:649 length:576 start_codon:yes stop_codon:yes gene_type:complete